VSKKIYGKHCNVLVLSMLIMLAAGIALSSQSPGIAAESPPAPSHAEMAAYEGNSKEVSELLRQGYKVNALGMDGRTLLTYAVSGHHPELVKLLLANGANPNADHGATMLEAAGRGDVAMLRALLKAGGEPNMRYGDMLNTPLHEAFPNGGFKEVRLLLEYGADPNIKNGLGRTPLFIASTGWIESVRLLIAHGAEVNVSDQNGVTPLIYASMYGNLNIARILLKAGADPSITDKRGYSAEDYAQMGNYRKLASLLKTASAHRSVDQK